MKEPNAKHPITVLPHPGRVRVLLGDKVIAETTRALRLSEAGYDPVLYLPHDDVDATMLRDNAKRTYCPYKGEARYLDIVAGGVVQPAAIWSYANPYPAVAPIRGRLAFDKDHVVFVEG